MVCINCCFDNGCFLCPGDIVTYERVLNWHEMLPNLYQQIQAVACKYESAWC